MASTDDVMASSDDVTVSVMMKTEDEGDLDDPNQNQEVILQLQPIRNESQCEAETDAAVMTVEAHADGEEVEIGYPITCGDSKALLLAKKFVCPGINVKCVKYEDQLISPKQFVHMSGKATLKDWKRAIRMGGVMLRKMMDSGQLDFYHHTALCTNTCRSTKFDLLINNTRFPPDGSGLTTPTSCQVSLGDGSQTDGQTDAGTMEWSSTAPLEAAEKKDTCEISEETLNFWKGIADVGLMGEVVTNISTELLQLLSGVQLRSQMSSQDSDCLVEVAVLSNLAQVFGLLDSVKKILERRKLQINPGQEHMLNTLNNLADQLEEQKRQQQVRSVSSPPSVKQTKPPPKRPTKRPRLQRPASTTTLLSSSTQQVALLQQQQQQFTVLSPISLSSMTGQTFTSMGQSFTVSGLPLGGGNNTVTLLPAGSQVITLHPSSGLTLVDPSQLGAMMGSTMELHNGALMGSTMELHNGAMMGSTMELLQLSQQPEGSDESHVEEQVVLHQEVEEGQETTVIQIDPASTEEGEEHHSMLLQQEAMEETNMEENNMEALVQEEEVQQEVKEEQTEEEEEEQSGDSRA